MSAGENPLPDLDGPVAEPAAGVADPELASMLRSVPVRVGAELGRARMPLAQAVDLGPGIVIELDRDADAPVELTVNGQPFAIGQLLLVDGNEWAIRIEQLLGTVLPEASGAAPQP